METIGARFLRGGASFGRGSLSCIVVYELYGAKRKGEPDWIARRFSSARMPRTAAPPSVADWLRTESGIKLSAYSLDALAADRDLFGALERIRDARDDERRRYLAAQNEASAKVSAQ